MGDPSRNVKFIPFLHLPRLDWMIWFCQFRKQDFFDSFIIKLLNGSKDVLSLLDDDCYYRHNDAPIFLRCSLYDYKFTSKEEFEEFHEDEREDETEEDDSNTKEKQNDSEIDTNDSLSSFEDSFDSSTNASPQRASQRRTRTRSNLRLPLLARKTMDDVVNTPGNHYWNISFVRYYTPVVIRTQSGEVKTIDLSNYAK